MIFFHLKETAELQRSQNCLMEKLFRQVKLKIFFRDVEISGLKGGAVWYDGSMTDSQRVIIEVLKWACSLGADAA